jgi:3-deoxy-D-manno-octulosonic-acid transferase
MRFVLDLIYLLILLSLSPWLAYKAVTSGKYRRGLRTKLFGLAPCRDAQGACAWFHGVSVGEIHLLRQVVAAFRRRHPDWQCVISTTTDTGYDEACKCFAGMPMFFWPLDFSWAVRRALRRLRPSLVVLAEADLWPNFLMAAKQAGIGVAVINGRMSPRSFRRYRRLGPLRRYLLDPVDLFAVQTEEYAENLRAMGVNPSRIQVTGSVKYDGVTIDRGNPRTETLRRLFDVTEGEIVWIAGSTQSPEEEICLAIFQHLQADHPNLRLFLVPRQKDRFHDVADLLQRSGLSFVRRSNLKDSMALPATPSAHRPIVLVDTIGELGALWGLADIAFVGGSLDGRRGGQNMIEPAAYGATVLFGPHVWNFRDTVQRLLEAGAAIQVLDSGGLEAAVRRLLHDPAERQRLGGAARELVRRQQGATERTIDCLDRLPAISGTAVRAA